MQFLREVQRAVNTSLLCKEVGVQLSGFGPRSRCQLAMVHLMVHSRLGRLI